MGTREGTRWDLKTDGNTTTQRINTHHASRVSMNRDEPFLKWDMQGEAGTYVIAAA